VWTATGNLTPQVVQGIARVNAQLSHAEQVKRWTVLRDDLSVEHGDLTPSLKLKRTAVAARYAAEIEALYSLARASVG
jgi:long-chain acyl-CoA synthetase